MPMICYYYLLNELLFDIISTGYMFSENTKHDTEAFLPFFKLLIQKRVSVCE